MMRQIKRKVCLIGAFSVGKTSLVARFVNSVFSEKYLTTVGVKVDKWHTVLNDTDLTLMIWDVAGEDDAREMPISYLQGAMGYLLVCDGTRRETLVVAERLHERVSREVGELPFVLLINKSDLLSSWEIDEVATAACGRRGWRVFRTSAKTGENVETAFRTLAVDLAGGAG